MDSDKGKLFIGGISWETTEEKLSDHFGKYGNVLQTAVMRDKITGKPRGFGFVVFADPSIVDLVLQDTHAIEGRTVEVKRAMSREEQHTGFRSGNTNMARNAGGGGGGGGGGNLRTKKLFVGGLPPTLSDMEFREYFEAFGIVTDVVVMYDQNTQRPRGFGFVTFDSEDSVDRVLQKQFHDVGGKAVEVKRALPKDANTSSTGSRSSSGGNYQSYFGSSANASSYENRMDAGRYVQPAGSGAGYNLYGSPGYGAPAYGYGGHSGYGNPSGPGAGYLSGSSGASRSSWNPQAPSGYGSAGYGAAGPWNTPGSGGPGSGHTDQSPGVAAGYGSQGYGYGGNEGAYSNQAGYGSVGGRSGGLAGNSIGGEQGGNSGYSNAWRVDPTQGGGYGTGPLNATIGSCCIYIVAKC
ncbi:heterogeneous nuclear ribonucleoprotein 1-like isoform X2 [Phalaenopsis equestris]|uniref:heterogeneous nuclear ribonucleoprotein 1-like isoform X2 n=1 Tax=Phalaenopsis equestris TaxID=78828 RepID=UPI0009E53D3C|nr:heterogeneous nuclear ribonucleoprotein 1-like isoform X2 [Phalaenopsis equestris]